MKTKFILFPFLLFFFTFQSKSNSLDYYFTRINGENGLSQNNIKSIVQDSWGFMWFGSRNKLNRYDGISIKVFDVNDAVQKKSNNNIDALFEDSNKQLWVGTDKGIFIFDPVTEKFSFFNQKTKNGIQINDWVSDIRSDLDNNIWIVIPNQGLFLYHFAEKRLEHFKLGGTLVPDQGNPECMCIEQNGTVWIGTNGGGVYHYNKSKNTFTQYLGNENGNSLKGQNIYTMCDYGEELVIGIHEGKLLKLHKRKNTLTDVDAPEVNYKIIRNVRFINEKLWVGTQFGLFVVDEKRKTVSHIQEEITNPHSLGDNVVEKIYEDKEGGIWVSSYYGGVSYLPNQGMNFEKYTPTLESGTISSKRISALREGENGNIWVGTEDGGLNILDPVTKTFIQYGKDKGNQSYNMKILSILLQKDKALVGYFKDGIDVIRLPDYHKSHLSGTQLGLVEASPYALCEDRYGKIWLGNGWGVFVCDNKNLQFERITELGWLYVYDISEDSEGNIWIATMGNGVFKFDPTNRKIKHYSFKVDDPTSLSSNSVSSISETTNGDIWFSTDRGGICRYNKGTDNFTSFSIADGLPDDVAYKILEDKYKNLWFGTNKGLVRFNPSTKEIRVFTQNDGLLGNQFNYQSALATKSGKLYFGGYDGLIAFDPYQFKENKYIPPVFITKLNIYNKEPIIGGEDSPLAKSIIHTDKIILNHNQSNIGFDFVALSFTAPKSNRYAYKMENLEKEWTYTTEENSVSFSKLPPGDYILRIKGANNDGLWNDREANLEITILPPWWQSKPALVAYFLLIVFSLYYLLLLNNRKHERNNLEKQKLFETEKEKEFYSAKVEFFTDIAHEIRTPLTLINGPLESLKEMNIEDQDIIKNLHIMEENTNHLLSLINQLLDFRKIDNNKFLLKLKEYNINQIMEELYARFELMAEQRKKIIKLKMPETKITAILDKDGLSRILNNLFVNAMKYSNEQIIIELSVLKNQFFSIRISNDGELIPKEEAEKIFDPFYQLDKNRNVTASTGIGLSLARSLAQLHNGFLYLDTSVRDMNCFVIELPLVQEIQTFLNESNSKTDHYILENTEFHMEKGNIPTLLILEDNKDVLAFIADKLKTSFIVEKATNGIEGLKILEKKNVDIIVSDVMMPEMDGYEFCSQVKNNVEYSHIPIILLTAKNDLESKIHGLTLGADAYIEKPFSFGHLTTQLNTLISNRMREREAFMKKPFLPIQQIGMNKGDEEFIEKIVEIINENITDANFNVEKLSELTNMSRSSLHRKITALSNLTPTDFIRLIRLKKSAEIIQEGKYLVGEVCYLVGINSSSYFIKLFHKQFGMTPKEYSKQSSIKE
ncbi:MAG: two-component regulator propeller domain-containing protein [Prolixibacteraceae bacterium]|jgi:signal transduction histidine kinase/ligand-binding sensor domain-containing protein/DNA-binding response OmpR family regulator